MPPFLPGYEPGTWVEIVSAPEMLRSSSMITAPLLPSPILSLMNLSSANRARSFAVLGKSGLLRLYFPHSDSYHIIQPSMISRTVPAPYLSFDSLIANL